MRRSGRRLLIPAHIRQADFKFPLILTITIMATVTALSDKQVSENQRKNRATAVPEPDHTAKLAYTLWESRGCPIGSQEEDWFKAEQELVSYTEGSAYNHFEGLGEDQVFGWRRCLPLCSAG